MASGTNLPPVVANPVSNITFETYPASQTVNLNNTFNDPDDPNENIVITVASNSNPSVVSATINNKILTVTRLVSTGGVATITLNAESAGQSVQTSLNQSGLSAQYTAATGAGYDGTTQYGVAYFMGVQTDVYASDGQAHTVTGCYVTNNLWAYQNMHDGDALVHISRINVFVEDDTPLLTVDMPEPNELEKTIGRYCAELIEDGACLQMGIGSIPNAILSCLHNHKNIGIHTEMFSDGILPLIKKGVITGENKKLDKGKIVSTFVMGSQKIYNFIDGNHEVLLKDVEYTNDPFIIAQQPKMTSINSAIQIDLSGQVCADSLGERIYSGVGGQIDYVYGSSLAAGTRASHHLRGSPEISGRARRGGVQTLRTALSLYL